ncbi:O-antigen ligase family protein [Paenibacillus sp. FSL H3-0333]|uniref:O-antigen ligase family protein n=1 Tax=Paenibacillus sp. FSL H3-0333 TaxID=2921373 RepID=UPI0030FA1363
MTIAILIIILLSFFLIFVFLEKPKIILYLIPIVIPFRFTLANIGNFDVRLSDAVFIYWIVVWSLLLLVRKVNLENFITQRKIIIFLFYSAICTLLGAVNGMNFSSIAELLRLLIIVITGVSITTIINDDETINSFFSFWSIGSLVSSLYSIVFFYVNGFRIQQFIGIMNSSVKDFYEFKFASSSLFEDPNNFASYLIVGLFISYGLLKTKKSFLSNKQLKIIIFVQLLAFILTLSRGAYIGLFAAIIINIFYINRTSYMRIIKSIILFVLFVMAILFIYKIFSQDYSAMSRLGLWRVGLDMTLSNPLFGVGLGNFPIYFFDYLKTNLLIVNPYTHNLFLKVSSETGVIGLLLFLNIFIGPLKYITKNHFFRKDEDVLLRYLILGLLAFLVQGVSVEYFTSRHFWILTSLILLKLNGKFQTR